jgi:hypothetical protein
MMWLRLRRLWLCSLVGAVAVLEFLWGNEHSTNVAWLSLLCHLLLLHSNNISMNQTTLFACGA